MPDLVRFRRSLRPGRAALALALLLSSSALATPAQALDSDEALSSAGVELGQVSASLPSLRQAVQAASPGRSPEQQIADAVLLMGSKDYERSINLLNQVVEKHADHPTAYPHALSLLGESYYQAGQLWSARRSFQAIVDGASQGGRFSTYAPKAAARLVDIAMRKRDDALLERMVAVIDRLPADAGSQLAYARGKALLARKDYAGAAAALGKVDDRSAYAHQARFLAGLVSVKESTPVEAVPEGQDPPPVPRDRYNRAIELFSRVTQLPADTDSHRQVIDEAWLAIGRLYYETDQLEQAAKAYARIDRASPAFGTMLYELAWVYVKFGDTDRALRALELLAVADPQGQNIADGSLLRGDLMLRSGKFERALSTYQGVKTTYEPVRARIESFLASTSDPGAYYDRLTLREFEAVGESALPPIALEWAREAENGEAAFAIIDDIKSCRELLEQSNDLVERLSAVLSSPARVRAFPELKMALERALGALNRTALARYSLALGMEDVDDGALSGAIGQARAERRSLEARLKKLPTSDADFSAREVEAERQWNSVSQSVQRLELEVNRLSAIVNGLRRVLDEGASMGVVRDPASIEAFRAEIQANERDLQLYRAQLEALRKQIRSGRVQAGFGDQRFVDDAATRQRYRVALRKELELAAQGAAGKSLATYAGRALPVLKQAEELDAQLEGIESQLDGEVEIRTRGVVEQVAAETRNLVGYQVRLDELDQEARVLVGEVAQKNLGLVRDRFKMMILRADVGITQQAWEVREDQMTRVRVLQRERAREERALREELNEVLDDAGESTEETSR